MNSSEKPLFAKFKIDKEMGLASGWIVSDDKERVDNWKSGSGEASRGVSKPEAVAAGFRGIAEEFANSIEIFQRAVPFMVQMMPLLLRLSNDHEVRKFVKQNGKFFSRENMRHMRYVMIFGMNCIQG